MKIKSLRLKNFKSFEDEVYFNFETSGNQNIILIGGENGAGKSSLFEAMKLCIYGPLTYKYQGFVSNYIARIKSYMNYNAFRNENVHAFIELEIYLNINTEQKLYRLKREWTYESQRLKEDFSIWLEGEKLEGEELEYFNSYLQDNVPPSIFDLFFFDGEELSEFFIGRNSDLRLKETLLTLCNYDNFDILRKELIANKRRRAREDDDLRAYNMELEAVESDLEKLYDLKEQIVIEIEDKAKTMEILDIEYENLYNEFQKSGGLFAKEREKLLGQINNLENRRMEINQEIKDYCNDVLPFIILKDQLKKVKEQVYLEEEYLAYEKLHEKLSYKDIYDIIGNTLGNQLVGKESVDLIVKQIEDRLAPENIDEDFQLIHLISKEQQNNLLFIIDQINNENINKKNYFHQLKVIAEELKLLRNRLDISLEGEEQEAYINGLNRLSRSRAQEESEIEQLNREKIEVTEEIKSMEDKREKLIEQIIVRKQSSNIMDMSDNMVKMLEDLIAFVTKDKIKEVEEHFQNIFKSIIRKDRFIDFIKIEDNFKISLYVKKLYSVDELIKLVVNVGTEDMEKNFGKRFIQDLTDIYQFNNKMHLLELLNMDYRHKVYHLNTKMDIMGLSSGEKQIYILCLYWALIKTSQVELPFVIDTPYGRIDEKHRQSISNVYFPNISKQVIVFSTNTEIDREIYTTLNPYIAKEYLLEYHTQKRKTIVKEGYFYEVNLWDLDFEHQKKQKIYLNG